MYCNHTSLSRQKVVYRRYGTGVISLPYRMRFSKSWKNSFTKFHNLNQRPYSIAMQRHIGKIYMDVCSFMEELLKLVRKRKVRGRVDYSSVLDLTDWKNGGKY